MNRSQLALLAIFGSVGMAVTATTACTDSGDKTAAAGNSGEAGEAGSSGAPGHAGSSGAPGHAGSAGAAGSAHAGNGGQSGVAGGTHAGGGGLSDQGGAAGEAGDQGEAGSLAMAGEAGQAGGGPTTPCGPADLSKPTVPTDIQVAASAVLVAAYAAEGTQTYTCQVSGTGAEATYAWSTASVPSAKLYDSSCALAATHYAGPHWKANDGSIILGAKVRAVASSTTASIPQLLLSATVDGGTTGIFSPVTAVQRLATVAGVAPSTGCDAAHVNGTADVPYTATYYFYSGTNIIP